MKLRAHIGTVAVLLGATTGGLWITGLPEYEHAPAVMVPSSLVPGHQRLYVPIKQMKRELERLETMGWAERIGWKLNGRDREKALQMRYDRLATLYSEWMGVAAPGDTLPALTGLEGWGALAMHECKGLTTTFHFVTSLANSGTGTLRDAVAAFSSNLDVVIFRTGGTIELTSELRFDDPCAYIAGQTAPGDGITIKHTGNGPAFGLRTSRVVFAYLRFRHNSCTVATGPADSCDDEASANNGSTNISGVANGAPTKDIAVYHISSAWNNDDGIGFWGTGNVGDSIGRITVQRTILGPPLRRRGSMITGGTDSNDGHHVATQISVHHNLFPRSVGRVPKVQGGDAQVDSLLGGEIVNNFIFDYGDQISRHAKDQVVDWVKNHYYKFGTCPRNTRVRHDSTGGWSAQPPAYYADHNLADNACTFTGWSGLINTDQSPYVALPAAWERGTRMTQPAYFPITEHDSAQVADSVLADVGANEQLNADGTWSAQVDSVDNAEITRALARTNVDRDSVPGPFEVRAAGTACTDSENSGVGDGMCDSWENLYTNVSSSVDDATDDTDGDGWLAWEEYISCRDPASGSSCSPDVFNDETGAVAGGGGPSATFGIPRYVYEDTAVLYLRITAGGADTDSVVQADTSRYKVSSGSPEYSIVPFAIATPAEGDSIFVLSNDSIPGEDAHKADSSGLDALLVLLGQCVSRGLCIDSLRNRPVP